MLQVGICRCVECGEQKVCANGWVKLVERAGNLVVVPVWSKREPRNTLHFCGRAHVIRYVDRWIGDSVVAPKPKLVKQPDEAKVTKFPVRDAGRGPRPVRYA